MSFEPIGNLPIELLPEEETLLSHIPEPWCPRCDQALGQSYSRHFKGYVDHTKGVIWFCRNCGDLYESWKTPRKDQGAAT